MGRDDIIQEVGARASAITDWPTRSVGESGLSRGKAVTAFSECVAGMLEEHRALSPAQFDATETSRWRTLFAYEPIERHCGFFAHHLERRGEARTAKRPYDQMGIAFPAISRVVAILLLARAVIDGTTRVCAFEPIILVRKPRDTSPRAHLHTGKPGCGGTLNSLALVAHCVQSGAPRCLVVGSRPLTRHQDLEQSVPVALRALLDDLNRVALIERGTDAERVLALTPVVCDLLAGGGPQGRGNHQATNVELVAARNQAVLSVIHERRKIDGQRQPWPPRAAVLRLPTEHLPSSRPRRVAPNGLEPPGPGWSVDPYEFAAKLATARAEPRPPDGSASPATAYEVDLPGASWCYIPAWLTGVGRSIAVTLLARRPGAGARATVWLTLGVPGPIHASAVEAFHSSRKFARFGERQLGSPLDFWVNRAYRRNASGDLLIKGGAGEDLAAGVSAAMTAAFLLFALESAIAPE